MTQTKTGGHRHVTSPDGTRIAVFVAGSGRPLVLVSGTTSDHTTWQGVLPLLTPHVAVHAVDRRGRGGSGDADHYALRREWADVAAVVDDAAAAYGGPVDLLGHSYGGNVAFGATRHTTNVRRLVLYEGWPAPDRQDRTVPPEILDRIERQLAQRCPEDALVTMYRDVVRMSEGEIDALRSTPSWASRVAATPTVPRELRAFAAEGLDPALAAEITAPVLLLVGGDTPDDIAADPEVVAAALPDARIEVLAGQRHVAHWTAPEMLVERVLAFLGD